MLKTADALEEKGLTQFNAHNHADYWPAAFQDMLDKTKAGDYDKIARDLESDVERIEKEFTKVYNQMNEWSGSAKDGVKDAIECILGKFECTMGNIKSALGPACKKIDRPKFVRWQEVIWHSFLHIGHGVVIVLWF